MSDVYVLGVDMIKFGRFPERTVPDLGAEAALLALSLNLDACLVFIFHIDNEIITNNNHEAGSSKLSA